MEQKLSQICVCRIGTGREYDPYLSRIKPCKWGGVGGLQIKI